MAAQIPVSSRRLILLLILLLALVALVLFGCGKDKPESAAGGKKTPTAQTTKSKPVKLTRLGAPATLYRQLPADTIFYLRLPSAPGWLGGSGGQVWKALATNKSKQQAIVSLRKAMRKGLQQDIKTAADKDKPISNRSAVFVKALFAMTLAPLELAEVPVNATLPKPVSTKRKDGSAGRSNTTARPVATLQLVRTRLPVHKPEQFAPVLKLLRVFKKRLKQVQAIDEQGRFHLRHFGKDYVGKVDFKTGELNMVIAYNISQVDFDRVSQSLTRRAPSKTLLQKSEAQGEPSHHGLFLWVNGRHQNGQKLIRNIAPLLSTDFNPGLLGFIHTVSLGWGSVAGRSRIRMNIETAYPLDKLLPVLQQDITPSVDDKVNWAAGIALPDSGRWELLEQVSWFNVWLPSLGTYTDKQLGVSMTELLSALGPAAWMLSDGSGTYLVIRIRDGKRWQKVLTALKKQTSALYRQSRIGNLKLHSLSLPAANGGNQSGKTILTLYWYEENGYLVVSHLPQILYERNRANNKTKLARWIKQRGVQHKRSVLLMMYNGKNGKAGGYNHYLTVLQYYLNQYNSQFDISKIPSRSQLGIQGDSLSSLQIDVEAGSLSLEFTTDSYLLQPLLLNSAMTMGLFKVF